jgi:predicted ATP-grasp superfamily ATP-dependent carboligase
MTSVSTSNLLIIGASTRAAAFSALRAGLQPTCIDLFADADLQARCRVVRIPPEKYPHGFLQAAEKEPPAPWMFTGGLENRAGLVRLIAEQRPLWGVGPDQLKRMRNPRILRLLDVPCPAYWHKARCDLPAGEWLVKPWVGSGGTGIRRWSGSRPPAALLKTHYFQEFIEGTPSAAIFVGDGENARLLGVTKQLVGESWLHAAPFHYCGSIGPLRLNAALREAYERLGTALANLCRPRGLFGVDCIQHGNIPFPVEVNPRYTASVELLEYGEGASAIALHRAAFDPNAPSATETRPGEAGIVGKAILFACKPLIFPSDGPWMPSLRSPTALNELPEFADIPHAGEWIGKGRPILTLFARADSERACRGKLRAIARYLESRLYRS